MHTLSIVDSSVRLMLEVVWQRIDEGEIARLAPRRTFQQTKHTLKSFVLISHCQDQSRPQLIRDKQPHNPAIDSLGSGFLDCTHCSQTPRNAVFYHSHAQPSTKASIVRNNKPEFFEMSTADVVNVDQESQKVRVKKINHDKEIIKLRVAIINKQKQMESRKEKDIKSIGDKKTISFDYEGKYLATNLIPLPNSKPINLSPRFMGGNSQMLKGKKQVQIEEVKLQNKRQDAGRKMGKQKTIPFLTDDKMDLSQGLQQVCQGVKITLQNKSNEKVVKQTKRRRLSGIKMYRLNEYQNYSKDKHFKQYSKHRKGNSFSEFNTINQPINGESNLTSKRGSISPFQTVPQKDSKSISLNKILGRRLPFLHTKGFKLYDVDLYSIKSIQSNRASIRAYSKSTMKIQNQILYSQNLLK